MPMLASSPEEASMAEAAVNCAANCECEIFEASLRKHVDILVVDDNQLVADTTSAILNRVGFRAITAYDGITALHLAAEMRPDILLSDVMMPILNGVELAISVRKLLPETAILLFTGLADTDAVLEDARREGYFFDIVGKPIHPEELVRRLHCLRRT